MIEFIYFSQKIDFYNHLRQLNSDIKIITPSPVKADAIREQFQDLSSIDVLTISKFVSDLLGKCLSENGQTKLKRKSEILLVFGIMRFKYLPELSFEDFTYAYEVFSDLRSYSLDFEIYSQAIKELAPDIQKILILFHRLIEAMDILDEHGAYQFLSNHIKENQELELEGQNLVFWGFSHLNGQQIDLLKSISYRNKVLIPIPFQVLEKIRSLDWIHWLKNEKKSEIHLENIPILPKVKKLKINSREISKELKNIIKTGDQILLGVSKLSEEHLFLIPSSKTNFKIPTDLLELEIQKIKEEIKEFCINKKVTSIDEIKFFLESKKCLSYKELKVIKLYFQTLIEIKNLTSESILVDDFLLNLLERIVVLNQPRTFLSPQILDEEIVELKDFSSLDSIKTTQRIVICVDDRYGPISNLSSSSYSDSVLSLLATIGPVKRPELDLEFKIWELYSLMSSGNVLLLITEEALKFNLVWKKVFQFVQFEAIQTDVFQEMNYPQGDILNEYKFNQFNSNLSSTKIQSFFDCKRKFYFTHIEKRFFQSQADHNLNPMLLGEAAHKILEVFLNESYTNDNLKDLCQQVLSSVLMKNQVKLNELQFIEKHISLFHKASNGISVLNSIRQQIKLPVKWTLEYPFHWNTPFNMNGKIDCYFISQDYLIILDFKSSSVPSFYEIQSFENVQIWSYLVGLKNKILEFNPVKYILGFVSLDNPELSKFLTNDDDFLQQYKQYDLGSAKASQENISDLMTLAESFFNKVHDDIRQETRFEALPRKESVCRFCDLSSSCHKGLAL